MTLLGAQVILGGGREGQRHVTEGGVDGGIRQLPQMVPHTYRPDQRTDQHGAQCTETQLTEASQRHREKVAGRRGRQDHGDHAGHRPHHAAIGKVVVSERSPVDTEADPQGDTAQCQFRRLGKQPHDHNGDTNPHHGAGDLADALLDHHPRHRACLQKSRRDQRPVRAIQIKIEGRIKCQ